MTISEPWWRLTGVCILMAGLVYYDPAGQDAIQRLWLPILMALGAWALTRSATAVALGSSLLAAFHSDLHAAHWIERIAYPFVTLIGASVFGTIVAQRFRARIAATHDERWATRRSTTDRDSVAEDGADR